MITFYQGLKRFRTGKIYGIPFIRLFFNQEGKVGINQVLDSHFLTQATLKDWFEAPLHDYLG